MIRFLFISIALLLAFPIQSFADRPVLEVGPNGLPAGSGTPEGVAVSLAAAFIASDSSGFIDICFKNSANKEYSKFLQDKAAEIDAEASRRKSGNFAGPKSIGKLFAARHLSRSGASSYGYATHNLQDVMFVDVGVILYDGKRSLNRTLVVKAANGKWYVVPAPNLIPLLSEGLNEESPSVQDFSEVYEVRKRKPT